MACCAEPAAPSPLRLARSPAMRPGQRLWQAPVPACALLCMVTRPEPAVLRALALVQPSAVAVHCPSSLHRPHACRQAILFAQSAWDTAIRALASFQVHANAYADACAVPVLREGGGVKGVAGVHAMMERAPGAGAQGKRLDLLVAELLVANVSSKGNWPLAAAAPTKKG